jgi:hypothetical protein
MLLLKYLLVYPKDTPIPCGHRVYVFLGGVFRGLISRR